MANLKNGYVTYTEVGSGKLVTINPTQVRVLREYMHHDKPGTQIYFDKEHFVVVTADPHSVASSLFDTYDD